MTLTAVDVDGVEVELAAWCQHSLGPTDRLLLTRSPDGDRVAAAFGSMLRTFDLGTSESVDETELVGSPGSVIFGWARDGIAVARDANATGAVELPLGREWSIRIDGLVEQDHGFGSGYASGSATTLSDAGSPALSVAERNAAIAEERGARNAAAERDRLSVLEVRHQAREIVVHQERASGFDGQTVVHWPPVVAPDGLLLRASGRRAFRVGDEGDPTTVLAAEWGPRHPWFVQPSGVVLSLPIELSQSPVAVLPDGRFLLPCAGPLWRDGPDEPLTAMTLDGDLEHLSVGGERLTPSRIMAAVAADWLPSEPHGQAMWKDFVWPGDDGFWVQAVSVAGDGALTILLAENTWQPDWHEPEACRWLVAWVPLDGRRMRLIARGEHADGDHESIAL